MATHHASPGEIVDLETWAQDVPGEQGKAIAKTDEFELARLVIPAGKEIANHEVSGPIVLHCIKGEITVAAMGTRKPLVSGQLLYLLPGVPHSVSATTDSVILLTIIFKH